MFFFHRININDAVEECRKHRAQFCWMCGKLTSSDPAISPAPSTRRYPFLSK